MNTILHEHNPGWLAGVGKRGKYCMLIVRDEVNYLLRGQYQPGEK